MDKELCGALADLILLLEEHGLENLRHPVLYGKPASKKKQELPFNRACRVLETYREQEVRKTQTDAMAVIEKAKIIT